jgi:hypothetical protein
MNQHLVLEFFFNWIAYDTNELELSVKSSKESTETISLLKTRSKVVEVG